MSQRTEPVTLMSLLAAAFLADLSFPFSEGDSCATSEIEFEISRNNSSRKVGCIPRQKLLTSNMRRSVLFALGTYIGVMALRSHHLPRANSVHVP